MSTITFQCFACQQVLKVSADKAGRKAKCVKCGTVLTIPGGAGPNLNGGSSTANAISKPAGVTKAPPKEEDEVSAASAKRRLEKDAGDERPRRRRRDDEEDDERPRRRRRDEDEADYEDDRPAHRGKREDDYDEDEERPRRRRDEDEEDYEDDRRRRRSGWRTIWPRVRVGMLLVLIALCGSLAAQGLEFISRGISLVCFFSDRPAMEGLRIAGIFTQVATVVLLPTLITAIVGYVFWLFVTNKNGALAFAIATLATAGVNLIIFVIFRFIPIFDRGEIGPALSMLGPRGRYSFGMALVLVMVLKLLEGSFWILGSLYLGGVGKTTKDRWLAGQARFLVIFSAAATAYITIIPALLMIIIRNSTGLGRGFVIVAHLLDMVGIGLLAVQFIFFLIAVKNARANLET